MKYERVMVFCSNRDVVFYFLLIEQLNLCDCVAVFFNSSEVLKLSPLF